MAWPPAALPINRTNATPQLDTHAADHNAVNQAVNDTVAYSQALNNYANQMAGYNQRQQMFGDILGGMFGLGSGFIRR